jgi:predicted ATPase
MGSEMQIVGREKEKMALLQCLEDSLNLNAQILLLSGEAGMGKSTLVDYLKHNASKRGMTIAIGESAHQDVSIPYRPFQKALSKISDDEIFKTEEFSSFDEIFLISKVGLLISHVSASEDKGMDEDILGSMLTAVQDFVKDSFGDGAAETQKGGLGKLEYLNTKIFIEHGDLAYLAVVSSGEEHPDKMSC